MLSLAYYKNPNESYPSLPKSSKYFVTRCLEPLNACFRRSLVHKIFGKTRLCFFGKSWVFRPTVPFKTQRFGGFARNFLCQLEMDVLSPGNAVNQKSENFDDFVYCVPW